MGTQVRLTSLARSHDRPVPRDAVVGKVQCVPELVECNLSFVTGRPRRHVEDSLVELDVVCAWIPVEVSDPTVTAVLVEDLKVLYGSRRIWCDHDSTWKVVPVTDCVAHS